MTVKEKKPPRHLTSSTRAWWVRVVTTWELEEHHERLLSLAARTWDEAEQATAILAAEGLVVTMPSGAKRPHPALRIANEARALFARLIRELDLDVEPPAESKRPPVLRSFRGGTHAA